MKATKKCEYCGSEFEPYKSDQRYCSYWCSLNAHRRQMRNREREKRARLKAEQGLPPAKPRSQKEKAICLNCGKEFELSPSRTMYCSAECYEESRRPKSPSAKKYGGKTLGQWIQEAMECNLDYGTYRGLIESGKSYEELKMQAPNRKVPVHQHTSHRER